MATLKAKQDDLRKLMKERRENLKDQKNKVDSPFAKYNSLGQLFCTICNVQIKNNGLWTSHVAGKIHKENAVKKKKGHTDTIVKSSVQINEKKYEMLPPPPKKIKVDDKESVQKIEPAETAGKLSLLEAYSSSSSEDEGENETASTSKTTLANALPKDFFDSALVSSDSLSIETPKTEEKVPPVAPATPAEALPEGFFDDPVLDAKARNIEYKDPIEEEWEKYQKAIAEETNVSKTIIEEDLEESILERDITQIDEQIHQWEKIKNLQSLAEDVKAKAPSKDDKGNVADDTDDELEENDLLDWRCKSVAKR